MEIKEILTIILFAVLMALNIVAFDRLGKLRNKLENLEVKVNDCSLSAAEAIDRARINRASISAVNDCYKELKERFDEEISENLEASTDKARKEAEAQQSFIDGLRNILDFDGGAVGKGEK